MTAKIKDQLIKDMTPVNAHNQDPMVLAAAPPPDFPVQMTATQVQDVSGALWPLDQLSTEVKALRQQALSTQASIAQMQMEPPGRPGSNLLSELPIVSSPGGAILGIGVIILLGVLWWAGMRRPRESSFEIGVGPDFVDSYSPTDSFQIPSELGDQDRMRMTAAALPVLAPPLPQKSPASLDWDLSESHSVLDEVQPASPINDPVLEPARSYISAPGLPQEPTLEFDPAAAADEVKRVLKSLASKRIARSKRPPDAGPSVSAQQNNMVVNLRPVNAAPDWLRVADQANNDQASWHGLDERTPSIQVENSRQTEPQEDERSDLANANAKLMLNLDGEPIANLPDLVPNGSSSAQSQDIELELEPDHDVQLSLAQEFEALGLRLGARELATEALNSTDVALSSQAQALLRQIDEHETAHPVID